LEAPAEPVAKVTTLGFVVLGLLFVGLALAIIAVVLTFLRSQRLPIVAIVAVLALLVRRRGAA
jgi:hypothetical protein